MTRAREIRRRRSRLRLAVVAVLAAGLAAGLATGARAAFPDTAGPVEGAARAFANPPDDSRIMMRWWWFGPAVTHAGLERDLRAMKEAGLGGVEIQPVYPVTLDDAGRGIRNLPFLSPDFLDALRFAAETGRALGLRVDLTVGSGWPYGGPTIPVEHAASRLRVDRISVPAGASEVALPDIGAGESLVAMFAKASAEGDAPAAAAREIAEVTEGRIRL